MSDFRCGCINILADEILQLKIEQTAHYKYGKIVKISFPMLSIDKRNKYDENALTIA